MALETITYTNPATGVTVTFGDTSIPNVLYKGITGGGLPPVDNFVVDTAYQAGAVFVRTKQKPVVLTIHLAVFGIDTPGLAARVQLMQTLDTVLGILNPQITQAGSLIKTMPDGSQRMLKSVQYVGGFEVKDEASNYAYVDLDLVFEAYDPTWYSATSYTASIGSVNDVLGFSIPFGVPLTVTAQATGSLIVTNNGNIDAHPIFTFAYPRASTGVNALTNASVYNQTTGESFALTIPINYGDTLVVDTGQGSVVYTPRGGAPTPYYSAFGGYKQWIRLIPGNNTLYFTRDQAQNNECTITWSDTWNHG